MYISTRKHFNRVPSGAQTKTGHFVLCFWGTAEGSDCTVVTSQPCGSPDSLFKGTVYDNQLCVFPSGLSVLLLS